MLLGVKRDLSQLTTWPETGC